MRGGRITSEEKTSISMYVGVTIAVVLIAGGLYIFFLAQKEIRETTGFDPNRPVPSDAVLKHRLKHEEYSVVRGGGTQTPFQNEFWDNQRTGIYVDVITGEPLFTSLDKFDNGTWPARVQQTDLERSSRREAGHIARYAAHRGARQTKQCPPWISLSRPEIAHWPKLRRLLGSLPFHSNRTNEK